MPYHFVDIALIILLASLAAVILSRLHQLPMIGYVIAGVVIGPAGFSVIHNEDDIKLIAEMGVILLLFILGMELPLKSFQKSYKISVAATFLLIAISLLITFGIGLFLDLTLAEMIVYGFIISLSSTAVAVSLLDDVNMLNRGTGQIAISILIAQDLLFIPMIMVINALGQQADGFDVLFIPRLGGAIIVLVGLIIFLSKKERVNLPFSETVNKRKELIPVAALAWCFVGAGVSELVQLSPGYGAFLTGLLIGNSHSRDAILPKIEPMQSVLIMVFFLSIGMLIDFQILFDHFFVILALVFGAMIFKTIAIVTLLKLFLPAEKWRSSFIAGLSISQIGEFSFILAAAALSSNIVDNDNYKIIIAVIALSLVFSPIWMSVLHKFVQISYIEKSAINLTGALRKLIRKEEDQHS